MSYYSHAIRSGMGLDLDSLLQHTRKLQKRQQEYEKKMTPLWNEQYALQVAAQQAAQQTDLQKVQLVQKASMTEDLMTYVPYALGGVALLVGGVFLLKRRRRNPKASKGD